LHSLPRQCSCNIGKNARKQYNFGDGLVKNNDHPLDKNNPIIFLPLETALSALQQLLQQQQQQQPGLSKSKDTSWPNGNWVETYAFSILPMLSIMKLRYRSYSNDKIFEAAIIFKERSGAW
jgi:hypothetical protein